MDNSRFTAILSILKEQNIDGMLISSPATIAYLTGYYGFSHTEREAFLFITNHSSSLITDARYVIATEKIPHVQTLQRSHETPNRQLIERICEKEHIKTIGFEAENLSVAEYVEFKKIKKEFKNVSLRNIRMIKIAEEIEKIRTATRLSHQALEKITSSFLPGTTEKELVQQLELEMKKLQVEPSFPTIVAFGENAAVPHHLPGSSKLRKNDVILIDFGVMYEGYCSDTTRTFLIGDVPKKWQSIYATIKEAQDKAVLFLNHELRSMNDDVKGSDVDRVARNFITKKGFPSIPHSLGHGIGLQVHESPTLGPYSKDILADGMVFSIEPGIYLPGEMGVRIEDLYTIQGKKLVKID